MIVLLAMRLLRSTQTMASKNENIELKRRGVSTAVIAEMYDLSQAYLKKDRMTKRHIPFFKVGTLVRYDPDRVHAVLLANEQGGPLQAASKRGTPKHSTGQHVAEAVPGPDLEPRGARTTNTKKVQP